MARNAFLDPVTRRLKSHGLCEQNETGDLKVSVADNFDKRPGAWRLDEDGATWSPISPPIIPNVPAFMAQTRDWFLAQGTAGHDRLDSLLANAPTLFDAVKSMIGLPQDHAAWARVRTYYARAKVRESLTVEEAAAIENSAAANEVPLV